MYNNPCWASWSHLTLITHIKGQQCDLRLQDSSDRSFALLGKTDLYTSPRLWEGSYWTRERRCQNEEKKISSSCNTTAGLFIGVPQSTSGKGAKPASGLFFWKKGENYVDFGVSIVSLHHTSEGSSDFYWAYGWQFDFDSVLLTLKLTSAICLQKKVVTRRGGMCSMRCNSSVESNSESQEPAWTEGKDSKIYPSWSP